MNVYAHKIVTPTEEPTKWVPIQEESSAGKALINHFLSEALDKECYTFQDISHQIEVTEDDDGLLVQVAGKQWQVVYIT